MANGRSRRNSGNSQNSFMSSKILPIPSFIKTIQIGQRPAQEELREVWLRIKTMTRQKLHFSTAPLHLESIFSASHERPPDLPRPVTSIKPSPTSMSSIIRKYQNCQDGLGLARFHLFIDQIGIVSDFTVVALFRYFVLKP